MCYYYLLYAFSRTSLSPKYNLAVCNLVVRSTDLINYFLVINFLFYCTVVLFIGKHGLCDKDSLYLTYLLHRLMHVLLVWQFCVLKQYHCCLRLDFHLSKLLNTNFSVSYYD